MARQESDHKTAVCIFCVQVMLAILSVILQLIFLALFVVIVQPREVTFHVTHASLAEFNYITNNNTLHYNLALNITVYNHNRRVGFYYDNIEVQTLFHDARFDWELVWAPFYQRRRNTTVLSHVFKGQRVLALGADLEKEKIKGVYDIQVKLNLMVRYKEPASKSKTKKKTVTCDLQVPLSSTNNGTSSSGSFQTTKCTHAIYTWPWTFIPFWETA